jgi:hypothetical protein
MSFNRFLAKLRPQVLERKQEAHLVINSVYYTVIIYAQLDFNQDWGFPRRYFLIFLFFIKPFPTVVVYLKFLIRITKKISCLLSKGSTVSEKNILKAHYSYSPICPVVVSILD